VFLAACSKDASKRASTVELIPRTSVTHDGDSAAAASRTLREAQRSNCLPLWPVRLTLTGTLAREVHLGPPNYGENPATDEKDSIVVLRLSKPITACGDANADRADTSRHVGKVQLIKAPHAVLSNLGASVNVVGTLQHAVRGWHFLPIIMYVDSIPGLKERPASRISDGSSHASLNERLRLAVCPSSRDTCSPELHYEIALTAGAQTALASKTWLAWPAAGEVA
jgi:hypothetical protein